MSLTSVSTREFIDILNFNIEHDLQQPILGLGSPGIGKSEIIQQVFRDKGYHVEDIRLAQMAAEDICGLIFPDDSKTRTQWLLPDWFPKEGGPRTVLLLDELTSATKRVQVAAYQLVLDRKLGRHKLPDDTVIVALGNRAEDKGVYVELAAPLANRFEIYNIESDPEVWIEDYAKVHVDEKTGQRINEYVIGYIYNNNEDLNSRMDGAGDDDEDMVFATPRSWKRVSDTMNAANNKLSMTVKYKIRASIGEVIGNKFIEYVQRYAEMKIADQVAEGQKDVEKITDPGDILFIVSAMKSRLQKELRNSNGDLTHAAEVYNNMLGYATDFPGDLMTNAIKELSSVSKDIVEKASELDVSAIDKAGNNAADQINGYNREFGDGESEDVEGSIAWLRKNGLIRGVSAD